MKKIFDVFLFVLLVSILVFAGLACIGEVQVQAASKKPSVPEFTIKFVDNSYDVASVQEVDPFTGKTYVAMPDYRAVIHNIEITIKNQPGYSDLWYNVRYKGQFGSEDTWIELYDISSEFPSQSESKYTVLNFTSTRGPEFYDALHARIAVTDGGTADFQVQAINGVTGEKSGWSNTKDLTVDIYSSKTNNQFDLIQVHLLALTKPRLKRNQLLQDLT